MVTRPDDEPARGRFEEVYDAFVVPIYRFVYARVGNRPDAEDLTAQVFMRAVEQLDTSREDGQIASWLYRVSQNAIADYWRAFYRLPIVGNDQLGDGWEPADVSNPLDGASRDQAPGEAAAPQIPVPIGIRVCSVASGPIHGPSTSSRPLASSQ
jgi:DNA-directed RNA polymerase specialized sigma24 family protein